MVALRAGDPIDDVIELLRPQTVVSSALRAHGPFGIAFDAYPHVKFGSVVAGHVIISVQGQRRTLRCEAGDVYLLTNPPPYAMASDATAPRHPARVLFQRAVDGVLQLGDDVRQPYTEVVGGYFLFADEHAHLLVGALPAMLRVPAATAGPLRDVMTLLAREAAGRDAGRGVVLDRLAQVVLVQALRVHDAAGGRHRASWLRALSDPQVGLALRLLHADVASRPSLDELATSVGMSRSAFAARFKQLVGKAPLEYAIAWRMDLARAALRRTADPVGTIGFRVGYESESAFSAAFRRAVGVSPRAYRDAGAA